MPHKKVPEGDGPQSGEGEGDNPDSSVAQEGEDGQPSDLEQPEAEEGVSGAGSGDNEGENKRKILAMVQTPLAVQRIIPMAQVKTSMNKSLRAMVKCLILPIRALS